MKDNIVKLGFKDQGDRFLKGNYFAYFDDNSLIIGEWINTYSKVIKWESSLDTSMPTKTIIKTIKAMTE